MVYLANEEQIEAEIKSAKFSGLKIQDGDKLQIAISAFDDIAVKPFNPITSGETSSAKNSSSANFASYTVASDGTITMPVLGEVFVRGMTQQELKNHLEKKLLRYLTDPMVTVNLANFNISVIGEVVSPGQKTSTTEKLNIFQALALAGDLKPTANRTNVRIIRTLDDGTELMARLNLTDTAIINSPYYYIQQNDVIYAEPDRNAQVAANTVPERENILRFGGIAIGIISLIVAIIR